jgi:capsular exopolysaccharide synthesis family protein
MSKLYDAIMKAQREQRANKKGTAPYEPVPEPQAAEPEKKGDRKTPFLVPRPKITPKKATIKHLFPHERIARVAVGKFVAKPDSLMAEQFRKLRSIVTTHNLASSFRSVVVTSCMPGEGKTKVAINLSTTIAKGLDDSVILIDADLRKKRLSSLLGLRNALGLSDVLSGRAGIQEVLINAGIKGLAILPAGFNPPNPAELIASMGMRNLLHQLKERYSDSYIIIDSTPIVSTSEANVLSQMVDGVIVVILADKTRRDVVKRELKTMSSEKILGVVLNCAEFESTGYYKKSYSSYQGTQKNSKRYRYRDSNI